MESELRKRGTNRYDTHPPLHERITAAEALPSRAVAEDNSAAITLIEDLDGLELRLLERRLPQMKRWC